MNKTKNKKTKSASTKHQNSSNPGQSSVKITIPENVELSVQKSSKKSSKINNYDRDDKKLKAKKSSVDKLISGSTQVMNYEFLSSSCLVSCNSSPF